MSLSIASFSPEDLRDYFYAITTARKSNIDFGPLPEEEFVPYLKKAGLPPSLSQVGGRNHIAPVSRGHMQLFLEYPDIFDSLKTFCCHCMVFPNQVITHINYDPHLYKSLIHHIPKQISVADFISRQTRKTLLPRNRERYFRIIKAVYNNLCERRSHPIRSPGARTG